ncbi:hypothetical protein M514_09343 [Trichuris suis]|uniref:Uncharacterized protein n=1 Tax=Trichuris suis TaxID=68888 RepID=A0A085NG94_9BILA|nr:hypothetical protein M514_09343 [Trichuris suis]
MFNHTDQKTPSTAFSESILTSDTSAQIKRRNKIRCGTRRTTLVSYFSDFMWRRRLQPGVDVFENILHEIAAYWPPDVDLHACGCRHAKILVQVFIEEHQRTEYKRDYSVQIAFLRPTDVHNNPAVRRPPPFIVLSAGSGQVEQPLVERACFRQQLRVMWHGERRPALFMSAPTASSLPSRSNPH